MSYNGTGTFSINSAGQPVVTGTTITSTAFNTLTADLATGLSTALCKDGQSTPTANLGLGAFKITNLGAGTLATDAARLSQIQSGAATFVVASGTDTILGTGSPALTAYATGNAFQFTVAATNTVAVTLNIDSLGAKAVTRDGSTALVAGDLVSGSVVTVVYDGTRFQVLNSNSKTNFKLSGTLGVTGVATLGNGAILGTPASGVVTNLTGTASININGTVGATTATTGSFTTVAASSTVTGTKLIPTGSSATGNGMYLATTDILAFSTDGVERMRIGSAGSVAIGTTGTASALLNVGASASAIPSLQTRRDSTTISPFYIVNAGASGPFAQFEGNGAVNGSITFIGATTAYNTTSDYRMKNVVSAVSDSGTRIDALKPINYEWKANNSQARGFLAHEFQEIYPTSVTGTKDGTKEEEYEVTPAVEATKDADGVELTPAQPAVKGTRTVPDYQAMQASTSEVIADLVAELQSLRKRIATLEAK